VQDRFTGDVGDFGKYGLLRALCGDDLSLGVVWYLVPDEDRPGDGAHIGFLDPAPRNIHAFRECDPALYDALGEIVRSGRRRVASVREDGVLPEGTTYYEKRLSFHDLPWAGPAPQARRLERRKAWAWDALTATRGCDVVFADPDNGLESGEPRTSAKGTKYTYPDELVPFLDREQSLIVYHHHRWDIPADTLIRERLVQIREQLGGSFALRYLRRAPRTFFVVPSDAHRGILAERAGRFVEGCWGQHFTLYMPEDFDTPLE
jgi:hypothetical protein